MPPRRDTLPFLPALRASVRSNMARLDRRKVTFFGCAIVLIALAGGLYLRQVSEVAAYSHQIKQLEDRKEWLHAEVISLRAVLAEQSSLQRCLPLAQTWGYTLPDAADSARHWRVEYQPFPTPAPQVRPYEVPSPSSRAGAPPRLGVLQPLFEQFAAWLRSPVPPRD